MHQKQPMMHPQRPPHPQQRFYPNDQGWGGNNDPNKVMMTQPQQPPPGYYRSNSLPQQPPRQPPVMPMRPINNSYEFNNGYNNRPNYNMAAASEAAYRFGSPNNSCQAPMYSPNAAGQQQPQDSMHAMRMGASFDSNFGGYTNQTDFGNNGYSRPPTMRPQQHMAPNGFINNYNNQQQPQMRPMYNNDNMFSPNNGYNNNMMSTDVMGSSFDSSDFGDPVINDFISSNVGGRPQVEASMASDWKFSASELRKSLLSRLKDALVAQSFPNAHAMAENYEAKVFSMSSNQSEYQFKLAEWLASIYDNSKQEAAAAEITNPAAADSSTSGLSDVTTSNLESEALTSNGDLSQDHMLATPTSESCLSPAGGLPSPTSTSAASTGSLASTTTTSPSFAMPVTAAASGDSSGEAKIVGKPPQQRRTSGSAAPTVTASTASNNPQSVDSGLGSPRSITSASSSTLYSPKIQGTSPSLLSTGSENSPEKSTSAASSVS